MPWGIAASAVVAAYSANQQSKAAKGASNAQSRAADAANDTQRYMYDQSRQDQMPWLTTGASALNKLGQLYGLNTMAPAANEAAPATGGAGGVGNVGYETGRPASLGGGGAASQAAPAAAAASGQPDYSAFYASPDYQFALQQGVQTLDRSAAARGRLYSGGYGEDLTEYGQGMAAQQLGNYTNRLAAIAGVGQTASNSLAGLGQNYANAYGQNLSNAADARASGYAATANANSNYANQLGQAFGSWYGGLGQDSQGRYLGNQRGAG